MPDRHVGDNEQMYRKLMVPDHWLPQLFEHAKNCGIGLFASVFSVRALEEILKYDVVYIKFASRGSTSLEDETYAVMTGACPEDIEIIASADIHDYGYFAMNKVLYCPEGHPPYITEFDFQVFDSHPFYGFSDHTPGIRTPMAFIRAGAKMIEKHIKIKGDNDCVDEAFSAEPDTMRILCTLAHR